MRSAVTERFPVQIWGRGVFFSKSFKYAGIRFYYMRIFHIFGVIIGAALLAISRIFWLTICYSIADTYETLEPVTCDFFQSFFFWVGVVFIVFSVLGLFRHK